MHWDDPEGRDVEGGVREGQDGETHVHPWLIHVNVWQNPPQHCKVISFQLIFFLSEKGKLLFQERHM